MTYTYNDAIPGLGCTVGYATTSGGSATLAGQLQSIDGLDITAGTWDSTGLASTWKEKIATIPDAGDFGFKCIYNPVDTTHVALAAAIGARTILYWTFTFASPTGPGATAPGSAKTATFAGYVTGYNLSGFEAESDAVLALKVSVTGPVVWT